MNKTVTIEELKRVVKNIIREARELPYSDVKFESIEREDDKYKISGVYEYRALFTGDIIEAGEFEIVLDKNLEIVSVKIFPKTERSK